MFKLPLLQPHLTGTQNGTANQNGTDGGGKTSGTATPTKIGYGALPSHTWPLKEASTGLDFYGGSAEVKDWAAQGRDITSEVTCSEKYKSLALHAEVKLAEALERCTRLCPDAYNSDGEEKPNKLKTAVCCQLLGEFAELCGPFGSALKTIRDELVQSIYSPLYVSDRGLLVFDQIPWFKVAERLEGEKEMMLEERRRFQEMLDQQQAMIGRIEEQVSIYQHATSSAQQELLLLRGRVEALSKSEDSARLEAKTGREELKRARKEWLKMKDDLDGEREAHKQTKARADNDISALQQHMRVLSGLVQQAERTAQEAQHSLTGWVPPDEVEGIQAKAKQLGKELSSTKAKLQQAEEKLKAQAEAMGTMTPRPSWKAFDAFGIHESKEKSTQVFLNTKLMSMEKKRGADYEGSPAAPTTSKRPRGQANAPPPPTTPPAPAPQHRTSSRLQQQAPTTPLALAPRTAPAAHSHNATSPSTPAPQQQQAPAAGAQNWRQHRRQHHR
ncbi:hypothetical protein DUNSADRAFT_6854 [Dunaliella salina]|uniref:Uncharacterized protein n=1 Tax=Dunaliella salina TaxID=3046 RepID=A0ABQ7GMI3_DUNSA|nr:hypothetical protein DUNSADRAFT_6854 [Dunaliella salina]|eukprot:KAF5835820.1 hypothetical protein DUNSADRAFT_6854 [Dunaliella salina]